MIEIVQIICYMITALFVGLLIFCMWIVWLNKDEEEQEEQDEEIGSKSVPLTPKSFTTEEHVQEVMPEFEDFEVGGFHLDVPFPRIHELGFFIRMCKIYDELNGSCTWRVLSLRGDDLLFFDSCDKRTITQEEKSRLEDLVISRQNFVCEFKDDPRDILGAPILAGMIYLFWMHADYYNMTTLWDLYQPHVIELRSKP